MAVTRIHNRTIDTYTNVSSYMIRDSNLSIHEKGILLILYSLPPTWNFSIKGLSISYNIPRATLRSALNHLEELGYLKRVQGRNKDGCFSTVDLILYDQPYSKF